MIIRRNEDGSVASRDGAQPTQSHPALSTRQGMTAMSECRQSRSTYDARNCYEGEQRKRQTTKVKSTKRTRLSSTLRQVLKGAFDPKIEWLLPPGDVPYTANDAPVGTEHTLLSQEAKRLYLFTKGGDNTLSSTKREIIFIQMLEGLCAEEAAFLVHCCKQTSEQRVQRIYC